MTTAQQNLLRLAKAEQQASVFFEPEDLSSPVGACPARQNTLFVVPARYALGEVESVHPCLKPPIQTQSQPLAARRLRQGYLYLWQGPAPLQRFAIASNGFLLAQPLDAPHAKIEAGKQVGVTLDKSQEAWLMYSERPLTPDRYAVLEHESGREAYMRRIALTEVAQTLEALHCPPLEAAESVIAELNPAIRDHALAAGHRMNADRDEADIETLRQRLLVEPTQANVQGYVTAMQWRAEGEAAAARNPDVAQAPGAWSAEPWNIPAVDSWLQRARTEAGALHAVFALLDDDIGMLRDLNQAQTEASSREEAWDQENAYKGLVAGFINSLINEDGSELSNQINYRYRQRDLKLTPEQGETLLQTQRKLKPLIDEETEINARQRHRLGHAAADAQLAEIRARQQQLMAPVRGFIPADLHGQLQGLIMSYRAAKARNQTDSHAGAQVRQRVRLDEMQEWIATVAEPHRAWLTARREVLFNDTEALLARHGQALWFVDYEQVDHCQWLTDLTFESLSELCSAERGVQMTVDLLRSPDPALPFSQLTTGFTPSLSGIVDIGDRADDLLNALSAPTSEATGHLIGALVSQGRLQWLSGLSAPDGNWSLALSRFAAAFARLQVEHLAGQPLPANPILQFPKPLLTAMLILRRSADFAIRVGRGGFELTGSLGQRWWDFSREAGQRLSRGLAPRVEAVRKLSAYGGALPLLVLALHLANATRLGLRDAHRDHDRVRRLEHRAERLKVGAALSAVIGTAWEASGRKEIFRRRFKAPVITLFGGVTGAFVAAANAFDLARLIAEQSEEGAYWTADHWARLANETSTTALGLSQAGMGAYATYQALLNRWTTEQAVQWFTRRLVPVSWLLFTVEILYFVWSNWFKDTELQAFLSECCWGTERRWADTPGDRNRELQQLLGLLFKPQVEAEQQQASDSIYHESMQHRSYTSALHLVLPGADPRHTQVYLALARVGRQREVHDCTERFIDGLTCEWLPAGQGMGLRLCGSLPKAHLGEHWQLQVHYHAPLAMLTGTLEPDKLIIGGSTGLRYLIDRDDVVEHGPTEGELPIDAVTSIQVPAGRLLPKEEVA